MKIVSCLAFVLLTSLFAYSQTPPLPAYDHILIVIEENKNYEQIIGSHAAPYINDFLKKEGATLTRIYAEEHHSQGNYFWLFSGSNQQVGFRDQVPQSSFNASNLGEELIRTTHSFKAYSEDLPQIGSTVARQGLYVRKHCPWVSFSNLPNGHTVADSSNLRFPQDFPTDYSQLPTVAFVMPNLIDDMHDGPLTPSITAGDAWLKKNLDAYYQWAKSHNSLLILTFDESDQSPLTKIPPIEIESPPSSPVPTFAPVNMPKVKASPTSTSCAP